MIIKCPHCQQVREAPSSIDITLFILCEDCIRDWSDVYSIHSQYKNITEHSHLIADLLNGREIDAPKLFTAVDDLRVSEFKRKAQLEEIKELKEEIKELRRPKESKESKELGKITLGEAKALARKENQDARLSFAYAGHGPNVMCNLESEEHDVSALENRVMLKYNLRPSDLTDDLIISESL